MAGDWFLLGSGPSSARWPAPNNCKVACVNSSRLLVDRPDAYGVFEISAGIKLHGLARSMARLGTDVYVRPNIQRQFDLDNCIPVGDTFGKPELHDLHLDVAWAQENGDPEYGQTRAWISSGVLMLWILAHTHKAQRVYVAGIDGYPTTPSQGKDYAASLPDLAHPLLDSVDPVRRRAEMNKRASEGIRRISQAYPETEVIWLEKPLHWDDSWNARVASVEDLERAYWGRKDMPATRDGN